MAQKKQQGPTLGKKISGLKTYKQKLSDVNLYQGDINDIWDKETVVADSVYRDLLSKDYTSGKYFDQLLELLICLMKTGRTISSTARITKSIHSLK